MKAMLGYGDGAAASDYHPLAHHAQGFGMGPDALARIPLTGTSG